MKKVFYIAVLSTFCLFLFFSLSSNITHNTDTYIYDLPFEKGTKHRVVQGYGGFFSHQSIAALDFSMPVGTPVTAAREGIVYAFKEDSDEGGPLASYSKKANYIIIKHNDGSFGCYWHLKKNGVTVKKGSVTKGQLIGYSGNTGFVLQPHLHFSVKKKLNYNKDSFVKTKFRTLNGVEFLQFACIYEKP